MNAFENENTTMNNTQANTEMNITKEETEMTINNVSETINKNDRLYFEDLKTAEDVKAYNAQKELCKVHYEGDGEYVVNVVSLKNGEISVEKMCGNMIDKNEFKEAVKRYYRDNKLNNSDEKFLLMIYQKVEDGMNPDELLNEKDPKVHTYIIDKKAVSNYVRTKATKEKKEAMKANKVERKKREKYVYVPSPMFAESFKKHGIDLDIPAPTRKKRKQAEQTAEPAEVKVTEQTTEPINQIEGAAGQTTEPVGQAEDMRI